MQAQYRTMTTAPSQSHLAVGWEDRDVTFSETAHDLANLLQILKSSLNLMRREIDQPGLVRARLATAMIGVDQCMSLSRSLFASDTPSDDGVVMLQSLVESGRPLFELAVGPDIEIEIVTPEEPLWVGMERARIERSLLNLLINAAQAIDGPGRVRVACRSEPDYVVLSVEDDGPGFTLQTRTQALDRRFTTKACGSGLGLASINALMKSSNGLVSLGRSDLGGACVRLAFPVRRSVGGPAALGV